MDWEVKIEGLDELNKTFEKMIRSMDPDKVEPVLNQGAQIIATAARAKVKSKTGTLKRSIKAKKLKRFSSNQAAPSIAAVDRRIAPHAHLVEYGHALVRGGRLRKGGKSGRVVGHVPAHPFWRPAVDENADKVIDKVTEGLMKLVEEAAK